MKQLCTSGFWKPNFDKNFTAAKKMKKEARNEYFKAKSKEGLVSIKDSAKGKGKSKDSNKAVYFQIG